MRILFVGMTGSIHTARWLSQIEDQGWEVYLFPVQRTDPHPKLRNLTVFGANPLRTRYLHKSVRYISWTSISVYWDMLEGLLKHQLTNRFKAMALMHTIRNIKPDIIHSLEIQHAGYLTLRAKNKLGKKFPTWIATNWGSDIYLFGKQPDHQQPIREVMENCDYYSCECERDIQLARDMGFKGQVLPVLPNAGGMDIEYANNFRQAGPVSNRKTIIVKGYQGWAGRALIAFQALRLCQDMLKDYTITLYSSAKDTEIAAHLFSRETGISIEIMPPSSHEEILRRFGKSRIYIGLSISDGISTSLLEAMVMGAFPIQSCTACADEWIVDGSSGFIVPPEDPYMITDAIRRALMDDDLVNHAAEFNTKTVKERLDYLKIKPQVVKMYQDINNAK
jgi:glycosyltransferase involved in cell wall biosynthesis